MGLGAAVDCSGRSCISADVGIALRHLNKESQIYASTEDAPVSERRQTSIDFLDVDESVNITGGHSAGVVKSPWRFRIWNLDVFEPASQVKVLGVGLVINRKYAAVTPIERYWAKSIYRCRFKLW